MKKIIAFVMTLAMILSLGTIFASAAPATWVTDAESFQPVGDVAIEWDPKASEKLNLADGKMDDWANAGYSPTQINPENMVAWVGTTAENMPADFNISSYFVADKDYLYIGFFIVDPGFKYGSDPNAYNSDGDAFQLMMDFGGRLQDMQINYPDDFAALTVQQCVFYSFDCNGDGQPLNFQVQHADNDGTRTEADEENPGAVKGTASKTETGWCAEFAMSWQMLFDDYAWKAYADEDMKIYFGGVDNKRFDCGIALYYLNCEPETGITWAAGTLNGNVDEAGNPVVNWDPKDCGIHLYLEYQDGMEFTCENLVVLGPTETEPPTEEKTEPEEEPTEEPTDAPDTDPVTEAPTGEADTSADSSATTDATTDGADEGCASVIGMSAVAVLVAAAAAVVLKKKD